MSVNPNLFSTDPEVDPFDFGTDTRPKGPIAGPGFKRRQNRSAFDAITGANPETDRDARAKLMEAEKRTAGKPDDETKRIIAILESEGWFAVKLEGYHPIWSYGEQVYVKKDFLGFADLLAFKPGQVMAVQLTTKDQMQPHVRKMASDLTVAVPGIGKRTYYQMVKQWFESGGTIQLVGWFRNTSGRWEAERKMVTRDVIELTRSRRKGR